MTCPSCGASAAPPFCSSCGAPIDGEAVATVDIPAADKLIAYPMKRVPPPGQPAREGTRGSSRWEASDDGVDVLVASQRVLYCADPALRLREAVVRVHFTTRDAHGAAGCIARQEVVGDGEVELFFEVHPGKGRLRLGRRFTLGTTAQVKELVPWRDEAAVPAVGERVEAELRVRGPVLQGWLGGRRVVQVVDPVLTTGRCGVRVSSQGQEARVTLHGAGVWRAGGAS